MGLRVGHVGHVVPSVIIVADAGGAATRLHGYPRHQPHPGAGVADCSGGRGAVPLPSSHVSGAFNEQSHLVSRAYPVAYRPYDFGVGFRRRGLQWRLRRCAASTVSHISGVLIQPPCSVPRMQPLKLTGSYQFSLCVLGLMCSPCV